MRKATTAIALATLIPDWVSTSDINSVYKWLRDDAVLPYGILRRQGHGDRKAAMRLLGFRGYVTQILMD